MSDLGARRLFAVSPGAYVDERTRLAKEAKAAGDKQAAKELQALKRPTLAMWALVAAGDDDDDAVGELFAATRALQEVQAAGDRASTVDATKRRRAALEAVVGAAVEALRAWEPSAEARRPEIRTMVDQLSRHPELAGAWIDGTLRELPEGDAFGFAAFTGMEPPRRDDTQPVKLPRERRLKSVPDLPPDDGGDDGDDGDDDGDEAERAAERAARAEERRAAEAAERAARAARAVAAREARREVDAAVRALAALQRRVDAAAEVVREAEEALHALEDERDDAARRHLDAAGRLAELTDDS